MTQERTVTEEKTLPSGRVLLITKEWTGQDQDDLTNTKLVRSGQGIDRVLSRSTTVDGEQLSPVQWLNMLEGDRMVAAIHSRRFSLGDSWEFRLECQNAACGETSLILYTVTDEDVACKPYPRGTEDRVRIELDGEVYFASLLTGKLTAQLLKKRDVNFTDVLAVRQVRVAPEGTTDEETATAERVLKPVNFKTKTAAWNERFLAAVEAFERMPQPQTVLTCDGCGQVYEVDPTRTRAFLLPQGLSGRRSSSSYTGEHD